jgi:hypothetical protein
LHAGVEQSENDVMRGVTTESATEIEQLHDRAVPE